MTPPLPIQTTLPPLPASAALSDIAALELEEFWAHQVEGTLYQAWRHLNPGEFRVLCNYAGTTAIAGPPALNPGGRPFSESGQALWHALSASKLLDVAPSAALLQS